MAQRNSRGRKALPISGKLVFDPAKRRHWRTGDQQQEPIDAEWWEDEPSGQNGTGGSGWQDRWDRTRDFFSTRERRREEEQVRRREADREQTNATADLTDREQLKLLRENVRDAGTRYMESLRASKILVRGFNDDERVEKLSAMHRVHAETMVMAAMRPLNEGVSAASVVRVMSTMAAMYLMSPTFRHIVKERLEPVSTAIQQRIDAKAESKMNWAQQLASGHEAERRGSRPDTDSVDPGGYLSKKWQKRYADLQFRERGHREMFTPRSAGMTEMALTENAFAALRQPGADTETIMASYTTMIARLYRQAEEDGISREEVTEASRVVLGQRIREDPRVQVMVNGFAHGQWHMSPPHEERIAGTDKMQTVWRGDFVDCTGWPVDPTRYEDAGSRQGVLGAFTLRPQMGHAEHRDRMSETMAMTMSHAAARGDMEAFNQDLAGYMLGCVARAQKVDGQGMPGALPDRLFQSRTMQAAMAADSVSEKDQRLLYSNAYADALEAVDASFPEFAQQWAQRYGQNWQQFIAHVGNDPAEAYDRWQSQQQSTSPAASSASEPRTNGTSQSAGTEHEYQA
ncbi:hypothetical protein ACFCV3_32435 [Kribbella sp. NPDC056345]|uniref:hypothetical protein n=1 Tax=Kribbella sp. NPDC056345 TaxID=3345789 RepID=UPI0035DEF043